MARGVVDREPRAGRLYGACQRRGLLPHVRRTARVGVFRPPARDGAAGLGRRAPLRRGAGRAFFLHRAATPLPLDPVASDPSGGCRPLRRGAVRRAVGRDADAPALRLHRRARRAADVHHGAVPADFQMVLRRTPQGMAVDGRRHGADGLQQIPRRAGGSLRAGRQPAATAAPGPVFKRRGGVAAARSAPRMAVRARLGVVRLPSFGPQFGLQTRLRRRIPGQHAGGLQPLLRAALRAGMAESEAADPRRAGAEAPARGFHRLLRTLVAARLRPAPVGDRRLLRTGLPALHLCPAASPHAPLRDAGRGRDRRTDRPGAAGDDLQPAGHPLRGVQQPGELRRHRRRGRRPSGGFPLRLRRCGQIRVLYGRRGLLPAQYPLSHAPVAVP